MAKLEHLNRAGSAQPFLAQAYSQSTATLSTTPALYSFKGLALLLAKLPRFRSFLWSATQYAVVSAIVTALIFAVAFPRQYALLQSLLGSSWWVWQIATGLTLWEALMPVWLLLHFKLGDVQDRLFDDVLHEVGIKQVAPLQAQDREELGRAADQLRRQRAARRRSVAGPLASAVATGWRVMAGEPGEPWLSSWLRLTLLSPLLVFWPFGLLLYAYLNGYATGANLHNHYLDLKGVADKDEKWLVARSRQQQYSLFGTVAVLLTLTPAVGWGLGLCNAAGAGLWAAEMEARRQPLYVSGKPAGLLHGQWEADASVQMERV